MFFNDLLCGVSVSPAGGILGRLVWETLVKSPADRSDARRK